MLGVGELRLEGTCLLLQINAAAQRGLTGLPYETPLHEKRGFTQRDEQEVFLSIKFFL